MQDWLLLVVFSLDMLITGRHRAIKKHQHRLAIAFWAMVGQQAKHLVSKSQRSTT